MLRIPSLNSGFRLLLYWMPTWASVMPLLVGLIVFIVSSLSSSNLSLLISPSHCPKQPLVLIVHSEALHAGRTIIQRWMQMIRLYSKLSVCHYYRTFLVRTESSIVRTIRSKNFSTPFLNVRAHGSFVYHRFQKPTPDPYRSLLLKFVTKICYWSLQFATFLFRTPKIVSFKIQSSS